MSLMPGVAAGKRAAPAGRAYGEAADFTYIPSLDGVRALAVLIVMLSHFGLERVVPGAFGVTVFFFVSGFIITRLLLAEYAKNGRVSVATFYLRRFWRLVPALVAMIGVTAALAYATSGTINLPEICAGLFYYTNYYDAFGGTITMPLAPLWSLAVEEHYYLLYGLAFAVFWPLRRVWPGVVAVLGAVLVWRLVVILGLGGVAGGIDTDESYVHFATDTRLDSILYGAVLAIALEFPDLRGRLRALDSYPVVAAAFAGLLIGFAWRNGVFRGTFRYTLQGVSLLPLFYVAMFGTQFYWARRVLEHPALRWTGKLSYSLYLWNLPALVMVADLFPSQSPTVHYALAWPASFALAAASYYWVEQPGRRMRQRLRP
ncbi:MAG: acyltransferase family protein [Stellaceae bacterium]